MDLVSCIYLLLFVACLALMFVVLHMICSTVREPPAHRYKEENFFLDPKKAGAKLEFPSIMDPATVDLTVVVPSYNEEERLPVMLNECLEFFSSTDKLGSSFTYEIIVVDDGSKDKTTETALLYAKKYSTDIVRVLTLKENRGKGGAVRLGVMSARGKTILFADADGAAKFSDVTKLLSKLKALAPQDDVRALVCGSRAHLEQESIAERSMFRTVLMKGFHLLVYVLTVKTVKDTQCGFKVFTRSAARVLFSNLHVQRWAFDVELLYVAECLGIPTGEVAIAWQEIDGSKMTPVLSWIQMGRDLLYIRLRHSMGLWSIKDDQLMASSSKKET